MNVELIHAPPRLVPDGHLRSLAMSNVLPQVIVDSIAEDVAMNARRLVVVVRTKAQRPVRTAADQIARLRQKLLMQVENRRQPMTITGGNLTAGFGTTNLKSSRLLHPRRGLWIQMTTTMMRPLEHRQWLKRTMMMMLQNVVEAVGVVVGAAAAVGVMERKRRHRQARQQIPPAAVLTSMMISARSCSKRIRKISLPCHPAA